MEIAIPSRRQIISGLTLALFSGLVPLGANSAIARNGGEGRGNGGGRGGGNGNSGGNGGNSGRGGGPGGGNNGNGEGKGRGNSGSRSSGNRSRSSSFSAGSTRAESRSQKDSVSVDNGNISVRHGSGIAEEVNDRGRYVMRDRSGRTIVNRSATKSDMDRLRSFVK